MNWKILSATKDCLSFRVDELQARGCTISVIMIVDDKKKLVPRDCHARKLPKLLVLAHHSIYCLIEFDFALPWLVFLTQRERRDCEQRSGSSLVVICCASSSETHNSISEIGCTGRRNRVSSLFVSCHYWYLPWAWKQSLCYNSRRCSCLWMSPVVVQKAWDKEPL